MLGTDGLGLLPDGLNLKCFQTFTVFNTLSQMPALLCEVVNTLGVGAGW